MNVREILKGQAEKFKAFSKVKKAAVISAAAGVVIILFLISLWINKSDYSTLFSDLALEDAGPIVTQLKEQGVKYKLEDNGSTIKVPSHQVSDLRIELAGSGALNSTKGFNLFDETQLGASDFDQKVSYQRALQGELENTIKQIEGVKSVRVHIVPAETSLFVEEDTPASASVVLNLDNSVQMKADQIKGIIYLVANSVQSLSPENVKIIDQQGKVLSDLIDLDDEENTFNLDDIAYFQKLEKDYERQLERRIQTALDYSLGPGNSIVMVSAKINFQQQEESSVVYGNSVPRSEEALTERGENITAVGGAPGTDTNVTGYVSVDGQEGSYEKEHNTTNYEVDQTNTSIIRPPGEIINVSAAVILNSRLENIEDIRVQIPEVVAAAVGGGVTLLPNVTVNDWQFPTDEEVPLESAASLFENLKNLIQEYPVLTALILGSLILLLALVLVVKKIRQRRAQRLAAEEEELMETLAQMQAAEEEMAADLEEEEIKPSPPTEIERKTTKLQKLASEAPSEVAQVLRVWLTEE